MKEQSFYMKNLLFPIFLILLFSSCRDAMDEQKYLMINSARHEIEEAVVEYLDADSKTGYQRMAISFRSTPENPDANLTFVVYSPKYQEMDNATYEYSFTPAAGNFSHVSFGESIIYDKYGEVISGTSVSENSASISGSISISRFEEELSLKFDLAVDEENATYLVKGAYNDKFKEGYVYY